MSIPTRIARAALRSVLTLTLLSPGASAEAQSFRPLEPGEEVRIRWDYGSGSTSFAHNYSQMAVAKVIDVSASHIMLRKGDRNFTVPFRSVRRLERRVGTRPASAPRMVIGSGLGFLGGVAFGILRAEADPTIESSSDFGLSMGVLLGAPVGALLAYLTSRERGIYERVGLPDMVSGWTVDPSGRVGLSFRVSGS